MQYVNITPHVVTVIAKDGQEILSAPASGIKARITETHSPLGRVGEVKLTLVELGDVEGLPEMQEGTVYIASMPLLMAMSAAKIQRPDVVYPLNQVRDSEGLIVGCRGFGRIA